jgi:hypothetical protein
MYTIRVCVLLGQEFRLANVYADEMVLQMAPKSSHIWGWGEPGSQISVTLDLQQVATTTSSKKRISRAKYTLGDCNKFHSFDWLAQVT